MAGSHFSSAASSSSSSSSSSKIKKDNAMVQKLRALPQLQPDKLSELRPFLVANDRDSSGTLSKDEFARALREFGVRLSQGELRQLFVVFDADGSGEISYEEFERAISGEASFTPARVSVVDSAFRRFDSGGDGMALLAELEASFQVASHPSVRAGQQSESACRREFVRSVDCSGGGARGTVSQHAFRRYFAQLSDGIEDDEYFEEMVHTMWFGAAAVAPSVHATPGGGGGGRQTAGSPRSPPRTTRGKSPWRSRPF
jgi:Ca2+-binding EF-hand superfamily protein